MKASLGVVGNSSGAERFADVLSIASTADAAGVDCGQYLPSVIEHINDWPNRHLDQLLPTEWKDALHELLLEKGREQVPATDL